MRSASKCLKSRSKVIIRSKPACQVSLFTSNTSLTKYSIPSLLKKLADQQKLFHGKSTHAIILQIGLQYDPFIASSLINLYFKCHFPVDAHNLFAQLPQRDATIYNTMLKGYFHCNLPNKARTLLHQMQCSNSNLDEHTLSILLKACSDKHLNLQHGKVAHAFILKKKLEFDLILVTGLIDMYSKWGDVVTGFKVFNGSIHKSVTMWHALIVGFSQNGLWEKSLELFLQMKAENFTVDSSCVSSVLVACSTAESLSFGVGIHCWIIKMGFEFEPYVSTSLISMYGKFRLVHDARRVFSIVIDKKIETWNSIISVYASNGYFGEALDVCNDMKLNGLVPDSFTISNILSACSTCGYWEFGRSIHGELIKTLKLGNIEVQSSLITMYMKSGSTYDAIALFDSVMKKDIVIWSSMINGFVQNQYYVDALSYFNQLRFERLLIDAPIISNIVSVCIGLEHMELSYQVHGYSIKIGTNMDPFVSSALIDMYSKLGFPKLASNVFNSLLYKNLVVFNSMVSGYGHNGLLKECIEVFLEIINLGFLPDSISLTSILASLSSFASLRKGKMIHCYQIRNEIVTDTLVENALLDMYMKCGCMNHAQHVFERMQIKNIISWNTMISGYGSHGHCNEAIKSFEEMKETNTLPDDTTFLALLSACSHSGLVEQGSIIFETMQKDYHIMPRMEHYANMVDLYSRAGKLKEALRLIRNMEMEANEGIWLSLLSSCRAYRCSSLGEIAAEQLMKSKLEESGSYTQILNFYRELGLLEKAAKVRSEMKRLGVMKNPGCSWIEVNDNTNVFYSGCSDLCGVEIEPVLRELRKNMTKIDEFLVNYW